MGKPSNTSGDPWTVPPPTVIIGNLGDKSNRGEERVPLRGEEKAAYAMQGTELQGILMHTKSAESQADPGTHGHV